MKYSQRYYQTPIETLYMVWPRVIGAGGDVFDAPTETHVHKRGRPGTGAIITYNYEGRTKKGPNAPTQGVDRGGRFHITQRDQNDKLRKGVNKYKNTRVTQGRKESFDLQIFSDSKDRNTLLGASGGNETSLALSSWRRYIHGSESVDIRFGADQAPRCGGHGGPLGNSLDTGFFDPGFCAWILKRRWLSISWRVVEAGRVICGCEYSVRSWFNWGRHPCNGHVQPMQDCPCRMNGLSTHVRPLRSCLLGSAPYVSNNCVESAWPKVTA
uniref:Uncharacterized protein n=1 Tax=Timema poppense TaxID=170557 RepID=A0A7R9H9Y4_TIMPO|nr:unnamed protein product [Timema poppensis]